MTLEKEAVARLGYNHPLSDLVRDKFDDWTLTPGAVLSLWERLQERKPRSIVEMGGGLSTLILGHYARNAGATVLSLDHEFPYWQKTQRLLWSHAMSRVTNHYAPLKPTTFLTYKTKTYDVSQAFLDNLIGSNPVDFLVIDGPPGHDPGRLASLPLIAPYLGDGASVFLDDADRPHEVECWQIWREHFPQLRDCRLIPTARGLMEATWLP